jgi:hypothetical protein
MVGIATASSIQRSMAVWSVLVQETQHDLVERRRIRPLHHVRSVRNGEARAGDRLRPLIASGPRQAIVQEPRVIEAYLGKDYGEAAHA